MPTRLKPVLLNGHCPPISSILHLHFRYFSGTHLQSDLQWTQQQQQQQSEPQLLGCNEPPSPSFVVKIKQQIGFGEQSLVYKCDSLTFMLTSLSKQQIHHLHEFTVTLLYHWINRSICRYWTQTFLMQHLLKG